MRLIYIRYPPRRPFETWLRHTRRSFERAVPGLIKLVFAIVLCWIAWHSLYIVLTDPTMF